jgi:hypothetical protein
MSTKKSDTNNTANLIGEINTLLEEMRQAKTSTQQKGGSSKTRSIVTEVNNLLSEISGNASNMSEEEIYGLAMRGTANGQSGGAKKSKSRSKKSKKVKSKSKSRSKSRSKSHSKKSTKSAKPAKASSKALTKASSKGKKRVMKREEGEKKKRPASQYILDITAFKAFIKSKLPNEDLKKMGPMTKVANKLFNESNRDLEKAKKNFKGTEFVRAYKEALKN